jgi:hypothetical protein
MNGRARMNKREQPERWTLSKGLCGSFSVYSMVVFLVVVAAATSGSAQTGSQESFIRCRVEGGNIPVKATTMEFFGQGKAAYVRETREFPEGLAETTTKTVSIAPGDYEKLWRWIDKEEVWALGDVTFFAVDAATYTFDLKKGAKRKTIKAMSVSTLENKKYYQLYLMLKETRERYLRD